MTPTVFVGAPSVLNSDQQKELQRWIAALTATGLRLDRLDRSGYGADPWEQLRGYVERASAVVVFGFRQLWLRDGVWRPGTPERRETAAAQWTTPWVQIEAGMAVASGLPLLVVAEDGVTEGAFSEDARRAPVFGTGLNGDPTDPSVQRWRSAF